MNRFFLRCYTQNIKLKMENITKMLNNENASSFFSDIDNVFLDCDGVIWGANNSEQLYEDAPSTIDKLKHVGKKIFLVTNNSRRTRDTIVKKAKQFGINVPDENIVCAPYIMGAYLRKINFDKKIYIIGSEGLAEELMQWNLHCIGPSIETFKTPDKSFYQVVENGDLNLDPNVGAVVVGFDPDFDYSKLLKATCYLNDPNCLLLATNPDEKWPVLNTPYSLPAAGVLVKAVESASGRKATLVGKPSTTMFDILSEKYDLNPARTLMVGDTLETDIVFGNNCGMKTLLVLSGVSNLKELQQKHTENPGKSNFIPQFYTDRFSDLLKFL